MAKRLITHNDIRTLYRYAEIFNQLYEIYDIKLFAIGGTLLGAVREQNLIKWDDDIDYGIILTDIVKLSTPEILNYLNRFGFVLYKKRATRYDCLLHLFKISEKYYQKDVLYMTHKDRHDMMNGTHPLIKPENNIFADIFGYQQVNDKGEYFLKKYIGSRDNKKTQYVQSIGELNHRDDLETYRLGSTYIYSISNPKKYLMNTYGKNWHRPKAFRGHRNNKQLIQKRCNVYVIGVFDLLHPGHFNLFYKAKQLQADSNVIVGICSDDLVKQTKNIDVSMNQEQRKFMIEKLEFIDKTIIYQDLDQSNILLSESVDIIVVPPDYGYDKGHINTLSTCDRLNIKVVRFERTEGISSSRLRNKQI